MLDPQGLLGALDYGHFGKKAGIDGVKAFIHHGAASHREGVAATQITALRPGYLSQQSTGVADSWWGVVR